MAKLKQRIVKSFKDALLRPAKVTKVVDENTGEELEEDNLSSSAAIARAARKLGVETDGTSNIDARIDKNGEDVFFDNMLVYCDAILDHFKIKIAKLKLQT